MSKKKNYSGPSAGPGSARPRGPKEKLKTLQTTDIREVARMGIHAMGQGEGNYPPEALCLIDLGKIEKQYKIWQKSFKNLVLA